VNVVEKLYTHYENGNEMLKLFQEWEVGELKENDGGGEFNYNIF
jgi:hypothetical protein